MLEDLEESVVSVLNEGEGIGLEALSKRMSQVRGWEIRSDSRLSSSVS